MPERSCHVGLECLVLEYCVMLGKLLSFSEP